MGVIGHLDSLEMVLPKIAGLVGPLYWIFRRAIDPQGRAIRQQANSTAREAGSTQIEPV